VSGTYTNIFKGNIQELTQSQYKVESGGVSEMVVSMSGNYSDKLYLGATLGVPFLGYRSTSLYTETPTEVLDTIGLKEFSFWENKNIDGTGVNLKLGAIYRPIDNLRIGLAFHTPTYYEINESYSTTVESEILIPGRDKYRSSEANLYGIYYYNFTTPLKLLANMAVTMGNMSSKLAGSLSFDYEFTNYRSMRFSGGDKQYMKLVNEDIKNMYRPTHTFRVGGTLNVMKLAFRLGAVYTTDPYKENLERDAEKMTIACGVGYQTRSYFVDFAYAHTEQKDKMYFTANPTDIVSLTDYRNLFVLTVGMKF
jgi:long-subunit fatty acid transport protein